MKTEEIHDVINSPEMEDIFRFAVVPASLRLSPHELDHDMPAADAFLAGLRDGIDTGPLAEFHGPGFIDAIAGWVAFEVWRHLVFAYLHELFLRFRDDEFRPWDRNGVVRHAAFSILRADLDDTRVTHHVIINHMVTRFGLLAEARGIAPTGLPVGELSFRIGAHLVGLAGDIPNRLFSLSDRFRDLRLVYSPVPWDAHQPVRFIFGYNRWTEHTSHLSDHHPFCINEEILCNLCLNHISHNDLREFSPDGKTYFYVRSVSSVDLTCKRYCQADFYHVPGIPLFIMKGLVRRLLGIDHDDRYDTSNPKHLRLFLVYTLTAGIFMTHETSIGGHPPMDPFQEAVSTVFGEESNPLSSIYTSCRNMEYARMEKAIRGAADLRHRIRIGADRFLLVYLIMSAIDSSFDFTGPYARIGFIVPTGMFRGMHPGIDTPSALLGAMKRNIRTAIGFLENEYRRLSAVMLSRFLERTYYLHDAGPVPFMEYVRSRFPGDPPHELMRSPRVFVDAFENIRGYDPMGFQSLKREMESMGYSVINRYIRGILGIKGCEVATNEDLLHPFRYAFAGFDKMAGAMRIGPPSVHSITGARP